MFSRYRFMWRRLLQTRVNYRNINVGRFQKVPQIVGAVPFTLGVSILTLIDLEKKSNPEDELFLTIKHCVLFIQRNEFDKAERLLHVALRQAQQMQHRSGITYIYDVMANLALERKQYEKAKTLFGRVSQRLLADGLPEDDPKLIHVLVKLAKISQMEKDYTFAQIGFDWSLEKLYGIVKTDPSDQNRRLLAMTEDWYGRLFLKCNKDVLGVNYLEKAYYTMKEISDIDPEHIVTQLNDIGTVFNQLDKVDESIEYITCAIDIGKKIPEINELGILYVNLGKAYIRKQLFDEARKLCEYGWRLGAMKKNDEIKREADKCLNQIK